MWGNLSYKNLLKEGGDLLLVLGLAGVVLLMIIPVPAYLVDVFLVFSITLSILIFMVSLYSSRPLDFSVFPTLILFATLIRLTLNVASTRLILLNGSSGDEAAGKVIKAFGYFVAGGNYIVGFIIFIILIVINFVVITKGAGRIAEVAARFTLDAMPGKQLAVDADLNAGAITDQEAKRRREELEKHADFYGAMDGASKFVRGDAVAGILITVVNVIGGFIIGMAQEGLDFSEAARIYTVLSIGDGLVGQIPALIISTAAGLIVTKVSNQHRLSEEIGAQTLAHWRPMAMAGVILFVLSLVPGLPHLLFILMAALLGFASYRIWSREKEETMNQSQVELTRESSPNQTSQQVDNVPLLDPIEIEVGYDLVGLVDQRSAGEFPQRVLGIRRQLATEMGILLPPVHIRDNLKFKPNEYRILLKGATIARGELLPKHLLALDPGMTTRQIEGVPTQDPTFGLPALWITEEMRDAAMIAGYTVVDLPSVLATHLMEVLRHNLHEIFGWQDMSKLIEQLKVTNPKLVSDLIPEMLPFGQILKVLQNLLREQVSIRDLVTIFETLAENAIHTKDPYELTQFVRVALGRSISQRHLASDQKLYALTLARSMEEKLLQSVTNTKNGPQIVLDPNMARSFVEEIGKKVKEKVTSHQSPVLLTSQQVRPHLSQLIEKFIPNLAVLAHSEVAGHVNVMPIGMIGEGL